MKNKQGNPMLYVQLKKALCRTFWKLLSKTFVEWGFKLNDYDPCVAKKIINRKHCTIIWHVDNLKILQIEKSH